MENERAAAEVNSIVTPGLKLEFVLDEIQRRRGTDPGSVRYMYSQINRARNIMAQEMQKCLDVGLDVKHAKQEEVDLIIDELFVRFVCQSTP